MTPADASRQVAVCIVTFNAESDIVPCLQGVARLEHRPLEVVVVDCQSQDDTVARAEQTGGRLFTTPDRSFRCLALPENVGFAGGMNAAIAATGAPWILSLNADAHPEADFVGRLLDASCSRSHVAAVTGRLQRPPTGDDEPIRLDACGMRLTLSWRHLDRGSGALDRGQFTHPARVFGGTGAATLFSRHALVDVALDDQVFDPDFHSFREDAELCFRLRERGWEVLYEPAARAIHRRCALPERRRQLPASVNYHSLKNRYLLRLYHQTGSNLLLTALPTLLREVSIAAYVLVREPSSLAAYRWLWTHRRRIWQRRRQIQRRRTRPPRSINRWFFQHELPL